MEIIVRLKTEENARRLINFASKQNCDIDISLDHYTVDAKSVMGVFSLDISKCIKVTFHCSGTDNLNCTKEDIDFIKNIAVGLGTH